MEKIAIGIDFSKETFDMTVLDTKKRPIGHFAGYNMPAAPTNTGVAGISTFWKAKYTFESAQ